MRNWFRKCAERLRFKRGSRAEVFSWIYATNKWGGIESRSGKGSDLARTRTIRAELPALLERLGIESILDLPCGDMNWMQEINLAKYTYVGADIVPAVIERNRQCFPELDFQILDICHAVLPEANLILCRDLFVHLCYEDIELAMANIKTSKVEYIVTTTFPALDVNTNTLTGKHRMLNLETEPFGWPSPLESIADDGGDVLPRLSKSLAVWRLDQIPEFKLRS